MTDTGAGLSAGQADEHKARGKIGAVWWQGLRSAFLLRPDWRELPSGPSVIGSLVLGTILARILFDRLQVVGPARFYWAAVLNGWFGLAVTIWICWMLVPRRREDAVREPATATALLAVFIAQILTFEIVSGLAFVPLVRSVHYLATPAGWWVWWGLAMIVIGWYAVAQLGLVWRSGTPGVRPRLVASLLLMGTLALELSHPPARYWYADAPLSAEASEPALFRLTQEALEAQSQTLQAKLRDVAASQPGHVNFYAITFAPYADEDVFRRESDLVAKLMQDRFGAAGRTIQLVNNRNTVREWPWATPLNLKRAIQRMALAMNHDQDVLFLHLTSHGARNGELSAEFWPLQVDPLTPAMLRGWLDEAGIRYRVISVSACYSGSWTEPLAGPDTLVMTAADADHTSYGCGSRSPLTYFGQAMYDEQLRHTWSFEKAHAAARPVIEQRERAAGKSDGYSNPQIRVGDGIRERLAIFEREREAASAAAPAPPAR